MALRRARPVAAAGVSTTNPDSDQRRADLLCLVAGRHAVMGVGASSRTARNLVEHGECVLDLVPASLVDHVDRLALLSGTPDRPENKRAMRYRCEPRRFEAAGLTPQRSSLVAPDRVRECPAQLEARVTAHHPPGSAVSALAIHVTVLRTHVDDSVRFAGTTTSTPKRVAR